MSPVDAVRSRHDAVVIGGGFYGTTIALYLAKTRGFEQVLVVEREPGLLLRASYNNQARVHNGYHYPRSFTTAYRSRINLPRFATDWPDAVRKDFTKLYAIARRNSRTSASQFRRFCRDIGAPVESADEAHRSLFDPRLVEDVFLVEELAFDATVLARLADEELREHGVEVLVDTRATEVTTAAGGGLELLLQGADGTAREVGCDFLFNCSYSGLNQLGGEFGGTRSALKHELTEMALVELPSSLRGLGVTVMDGPFFSVMPFPARGLHTLSHVRYTPHLHWTDVAGLDPYDKLAASRGASRFDWMIRDVARYLPALTDAQHVDSLFEVKTVLTRNESDDGRPILFERHPELPGCYSILGGKIDNIYDVLEKLDAEPLVPSRRSTVGSQL